MAASSPAPDVGSNSADGLWKRAVDSLNDEERRGIDFTRTDKLSILDDILSAVLRKERGIASRKDGSTEKETTMLLFVIS